MRDFFDTFENRVYTSLALVLGGVTLLFIAPQSTSLTLFQSPLPNDVFYAAFFILGVLILGSVFYFSKEYTWKKLLPKLLLTTLPGTIFMLYGFIESNNFHYIFWIGLGLYVIATGTLLSALYMDKMHATLNRDPGRQSFSEWFRAQGFVHILIVLATTLVFFVFGLFQLTHFAAVDEALWYEGRIAKYWNNIEERDWKGTRISDKPGITVALTTAPGLFSFDPKKFDKMKYNGEPIGESLVEKFYFAFRFPFLLSITLLLPLFYFFLERLLGKRSALLSYIFIALSPVLVGISKIINPDSLLWLFAPLALLSYLVFLKRGSYRYLIFSGILLGLALLTKYVANILFIFFLGLIFLEYIYHEKKTLISFANHLKKALGDLAVLTFSALATVYILFPAIWVKPDKLLTSTVFSQAFTKVAPLFFIIISFILLDQWFGKSRITSALLNQLSKIKHWIAYLLSLLFLVAIGIVVWNTWTGMPLYNFSELLASPKTIASRSDFLGVFLTNFYPLLFGVSPWVFILLFLSPLFFFQKKFFTSTRLRTSFYLMIFILLYYLGTTVNNVAAIVRYQIILFPLAAIIAGITLSYLLRFLYTHTKIKEAFITASICTLILLSGAYSLFKNPFPLSYVNVFLPKHYHIDLKDMGGGSYEAAMYLNSLPNARDLLIWTDKDGVCKFFIGTCKSNNRNYMMLRAGSIDYIVVSAGRKNRTTKMMLGDITSQKPGLIRFDQYYDREDPEFRININDRPSHYVKVFKFEENI